MKKRLIKKLTMLRVPCCKMRELPDEPFGLPFEICGCTWNAGLKNCVLQYGRLCPKYVPQLDMVSFLHRLGKRNRPLFRKH